MRYAAILIVLAGCAHVTHEYTGEAARPRLLSALEELATDGLVLVSHDRVFVLPPDVVRSERRALAAALASTISSPPAGTVLRITSDSDSEVRAFHYPSRFLEVEKRDVVLVVERLDWEAQDGYWIVCEVRNGDRYAALTWGTPELDSAWDRLEERATELAGGRVSRPPLSLPGRMPTAGEAVRSVGIDLRGFEGKIEIQGTTFEVVR